MFAWFDASNAKAFGHELAVFFVERMPSDSKIGEKAFAQKADKLLAKMSAQVLRFCRENKLNPYKKAQLGNTFKWTLREAGLSVDYADKLTDWLMLQLP